MCTQLLRWVQLFETPLSMEFPRQEYESRLPFPSPGGLPDPGIEPASPALTGRFFTIEPPGKPFIAMARVQSLVWELRSCKLRSAAKKYKVNWRTKVWGWEETYLPLLFTLCSVLIFYHFRSLSFSKSKALFKKKKKRTHFLEERKVLWLESCLLKRHMLKSWPPQYPWSYLETGSLQT